jgi:signal transduction histidine kinase
VDVPDGLMLKVDRSWFVTSVLNNLMSNAIKFCYENGNISIKAEYGESGVKVVFSDDGTGVPEYVAEKMFTNKSVSTSGTSGERGTGFGMPLVKRWVEVFNGTIVLETRPEEDYPEEHGTSFILNFPLCES